MDSIIMKGRSEQEAIEKALLELNTNENAVTIEVLEEAEDRLFGLLVKPAVVKLTKKQRMEENEKAEEKMREVAQEREGTAWITDGKVMFKASETKKPTIIPNEQLIITLNDEVIEEETELMNGDKVDIQGKSIVSATDECHIHLDAQKLSAQLAFHPGFEDETMPLDTPPAERLMPKHKTTQRRHRSLTEEAIRTKIQQRGIVYGIFDEVIASIPSLDESEEIMIAKGLEEIPGENGKIEFLIDMEAHLLKPKQLPDGTVDYREIRKIPTITAGEIIGIIHPPEAGKQGRTVTNEVIKVSTTREVHVTGQEINISEDGAIIATKTGTPNVLIRYPNVTIDILNTLTHHGDVDIRSGNITFIGDVEISGNVEESMIVETEGKLLIQQSVHGANVIAQTALVVNRNVVRSTVVVGAKDEVSFLQLKQSEKLHEHIQSFHRNLAHLLSVQRESEQMKDKDVDLAVIVRILMQQKFPSLPDEVSTYIHFFTKEQKTKSHPIEKTLLDQLHLVFLSIDSQVLRDETIFTKIQDQLNTLILFYHRMLKPFASVTIAAAQQSDIYCNGDVFVSGRGTYNTTIESRGNVFVKGLIRGGSIQAEGNIEVNEVGSNLGVETLLAVPKNKQIKISHAMEEAVIRIGNRTHRFATERKQVLARLDDETGAIIFL